MELTLESFIKVVSKMRESQKTYYKSYSAKSKQDMTEAERYVDKVINDFNTKKKQALEAAQNTLF